MTPPNMMTMRGPYLSTNQASIGTSQVSVTTKMVKASWIAARPQWCGRSIGPTNRVHPYCRVAIIAMQTMPMTSWSQRKPVRRGAAVTAPSVLEIIKNLPSACLVRHQLQDDLMSQYCGLSSQAQRRSWYTIFQIASPIWHAGDKMAGFRSDRQGSQDAAQNENARPQGRAFAREALLDASDGRLRDHDLAPGLEYR